MRKNWWKWALGAGVALVVLIVGGSWLYIKVIEGDPAKPLSFEDLNSSSTTSAASTTATTATGATGGTQTGIDGTWKAVDTSQVGYRVKETLFGQSTEAVGRTNSVTGSLAINGTSVNEGEFTVDMTSVQSDSSQPTASSTAAS